MMKDKRIFLLVLALMVLGWGIAVYLYLDYKNKDLYHGKIYHRQAPHFVLTGNQGSKVRLDQFQDKIVLIAWGYTNCPDICPLTLTNLKEVMDSLGQDAKDVQVLFITVDPERDTVERLNSYVPYFHEDFIGLTGSQEEIEEIADDYMVTVVKHPAVYGRGRFDTWDRYLMTHTNIIHLVDQNGRLFLTYPHYKHDPQEMAKDIKKLLHY
ncbi:MAG: redoxin domain-containing protein [Candidatus Dadabacteria bacterium]|nr:MAG: redoxin domain-containing protein [Candidatus Dadabacteria bacterium]TDJ02282.1 MAG: redoxin domain-containing protein [Candidatus Dadabacteria bacterium]